jgi:general stress protein YciG
MEYRLLSVLHSMTPRTTKRSKKRGLAKADQRTRKRVAREGGQAVSRNRAHMAEIGRRGGVAVSRDRKHMAEIGRKGGRA